MVRFKLVGSIIREIEHLPIAEIEAKNLNEAYEKYRIRYVKDKLSEGLVEFIRLVDEEDIDNMIAEHILKDD